MATVALMTFPATRCKVRKEMRRDCNASVKTACMASNFDWGTRKEAAEESHKIPRYFWTRVGRKSHFLINWKTPLKKKEKRLGGMVKKLSPLPRLMWGSVAGRLEGRKNVSFSPHFNSNSRRKRLAPFSFRPGLVYAPILQQ